MSATPDKSGDPYRTNAEIAEEIPPMPKAAKKPTPWPVWVWSIIVALSSVVVIGVISDVYSRLPAYHGTLVGVGCAIGMLGFGALMRFWAELV